MTAFRFFSCGDITPLRRGSRRSRATDFPQSVSVGDSFVQKLLAELIQLVHDLSDLTLLDTAHALDRYLFGYIPKINGSGFAVACSVSPADFNVKAVTEVTINTAFKVDVPLVMLWTLQEKRSVRY